MPAPELCWSGSKRAIAATEHFCVATLPTHDDNAVRRRSRRRGNTATSPSHSWPAAHESASQPPEIVQHTVHTTRYRVGGGKMTCPQQWQFDGGISFHRQSKIAADLRDRSSASTSLVAGGSWAAGSQRAYSLGSCTMGQRDGQTALFQNAPLERGHNKLAQYTSSQRLHHSRPLLNKVEYVNHTPDILYAS